MKEIKEEKVVEEEIEEKEHPILKKVIIIAICTIVLSLLYINLIGTKVIEIKEYKVSSIVLPNSFDGLKIIHFSDIHYGTTISKNELNKLVDKINKQKPDIIVFTGDLINKNITLDDSTKETIIETLSKLESNLYKYAIYGDEDIDNESYKEIIEQSGFILLDNESTLLYYKDTTPIKITGISPINTSPNYNVISDSIDDYVSSTLYNLVLVHEPDSYETISTYYPNLTLSGHTLGNLVRIPGIENLFKKDNSKIYYKDYYNINDNDLYISSGLGTSNFKSRINNRPSFNLYRLYKE